MYLWYYTYRNDYIEILRGVYYSYEYYSFFSFVVGVKFTTVTSPPSKIWSNYAPFRVHRKYYIILLTRRRRGLGADCKKYANQNEFNSSSRDLKKCFQTNPNGNNHILPQYGTITKFAVWLFRLPYGMYVPDLQANFHMTCTW